MIHSTRGIVLNHIKYAESSIVVHIYTEIFGRQSYLVNSVRSSRNKGKSILLQPLTLLEMQVYHNQKKSLQRIKEFRISTPIMNIPFNQVKRSIAFFITEMMNRSLQEEMANPELYSFVEQAIMDLDITNNGHYFHLLFLAALTRYLGFFPDLSGYGDKDYFDLQQGILTDLEPFHSNFLKGDLMKEWIGIFEKCGDSLTLHQCKAEYRNDLIDAIIDYYRLHLHDFGKLKSLDVLRSLFHE